MFSFFSNVDMGKAVLKKAYRKNRKEEGEGEGKPKFIG